MFGLVSARRYRELEAQFDAAAELVEEAQAAAAQALANTEPMRDRIVNLRREIHELTKQRGEARKTAANVVDTVRSLLASKRYHWAEGAVHDGNHDMLDCDACLVFGWMQQLADEGLGTDWLKLVRDQDARQGVLRSLARP